MAGELIEIDGTFGEGGGQVLRTSLTLSCVTGRSIRITDIRGKRSRPGLRRQHLVAVRAARDISAAEVTGDELRSVELSFTPGPVKPGRYEFEIPSAGSTVLVAQTLLPALLVAGGPSEFTVTGGTHNPWAPPFDFVAEVFVPALGRMGCCVEAQLLRHGFFPDGGGRIALQVEPWDPHATAPLDLCQPVHEVHWTGRIYDSQLPPQVIESERTLIRRLLPAVGRIEHRQVTDAAGGGNCMMAVGEGAWGKTILTAYGEKGKPARFVAKELREAFDAFISAAAPVDAHLADQLLVYLALAGRGRFNTGALSLHARTNMDVIERFLPVRFTIEPSDGGHIVSCAPAA